MMGKEMRAEAYAAGYRAALHQAAALCKEMREVYNRDHGKSHTDVGDMATACARAIGALLDEPPGSR